LRNLLANSRRLRNTDMELAVVQEITSEAWRQTANMPRSGGTKIT